jgi:hypothetical protein
MYIDLFELPLATKSNRVYDVLLHDVCSSSSQPISRLNAIVFLYLQPFPDGGGSLGKITIVCAGADGDGAAVASAVPRIARRGAAR